MKRLVSLLAVVAMTAFLFSAVLPVAAQDSQPRGTITAPPSTLGIPGLPRTPLYIFVPEGGVDPSAPPASAETPSSLACLYGVTKPTKGCPRNGSVVATGGANAIAVVEYGSNSTLQSDAKTFASQFGLPVPNITEVCATGGTCPSNDGTGWDLETALDVQYAHAMAPNAQIYVVEFSSDPIGDGAETKAAALVAKAGGGEVSNSWTYNGGESSGEKGDDKYFTTKTVVYFGSAGDGGLGPLYPSISPNVVSAGGTTVLRNGNGGFTSESCWSGSGGGISRYESRPSYQTVIKKLVGSKRGTPDIAADASPNSGAAVYSTTYAHGWIQVGGTSLSSPLLAGITNAAAGFAASTHAELTKVYKEYGNATQYKKLFRDITTGSNGKPATKGWDQCTGVGSPKSPKGE